MNIFSKITPLFLAIVVTACLPGDAGMYVQGSIVDEQQTPYPVCVVTLLDLNGGSIGNRLIALDKPAPASQISLKPQSKFNELVVYSTYDRPVSVTISCKGSQQIARRRIKEDRNNTPENPLDLGVIVLARDP